jgi:hypothetical protein
MKALNFIINLTNIKEQVEEEDDEDERPRMDVH